MVLESTGVLGWIDDILRGRARASGQRSALPQVCAEVASVVLFGSVYGIVMGAHGEARLLQMVYSGLKIPLLILSSFLLTLPAVCMLQWFLGLHHDLGRTIRTLMRMQVGVAVFFAAMAPVVAFLYVSGISYWLALIVNVLVFGLGSLYGFMLLRELQRDLVARDARHRWCIRAWVGLYAVVVIQMAWMMRPFVGDPTLATEFFRGGQWDNAYLVVGELLLRTMSGS